MAKASAGNVTNYNKSANACPNSAARAHLSSKASEPRLTVAQVRAALVGVDMSPGSLLHRAARYHGWLAQTDPDDLLQDALLKAVTTRSCPAHVQVDRYVRGIIRSIASGIVAKRERNRNVAELARAAEEERLSNSVLSPDEELDRRERAGVCEEALARIGEGHRLTARGSRRRCSISTKFPLFSRKNGKHPQERSSLPTASRTNQSHKVTVARPWAACEWRSSTGFGARSERWLIRMVSGWRREKSKAFRITHPRNAVSPRFADRLAAQTAKSNCRSCFAPLDRHVADRQSAARKPPCAGSRLRWQR